ncbi:MAG: TIGR02281 family clan AA aspartic protease [Burkholderiaceae bacterium]|nr:TIGR02281 family clan AA aspartic protease [Burkholderiaceae bacterium]
MPSYIIAFAMLLAATTAQSQSVTLSGMVGSKALLIVDGSAPKIVDSGETFQGVKLISTSGDTAVLEMRGRRLNLRVGESPASVGGGQSSAGSGSKIVLSAADGGHFMAMGSINGKAAQFMVDTGATTVAMGAAEAQRMGLNYTSGKPVRMNTANGQTLGYLLTLNSVRVGNVEVLNVDAIVSQQPMPYVLLGNSFLTRFSMRRDSDQMVLERRY